MELNGKLSEEDIRTLIYLSGLDLDALKDLFTSVNIWSFTATEEIAAGTQVEIPEYVYTMSSIIVMLNGLATLDFEKELPTEGDNSSYIKFKDKILKDTKVIGITFTVSSTGTDIPSLIEVKTDATLVGKGTIVEPLGINPTVLKDISDRIEAVASTINIKFNDTITGAGTTANPFGVSTTITKGISDNTTAISSLKTTVEALPTIAQIIQEVEKTTVERIFLSEVTAKTTATGGTLESKTLSNKGVTGTASSAIPIVSGTVAGLAPASMYTKIESMQTQIDAISGTAPTIVDDTLEANATQVQLAASWIVGGKTLVEGSIIENWKLSLRWVYRSNTWEGPYAFNTVTIATTTTPGSVLSSEDKESNRGKIFVEVDGSMSLVGYDNITARLDAIVIPTHTGSNRIWSATGSVSLPYVANTNIEVPAYVKDKGALDVYINGVRTDQFTKVDTTKISINNAIAGTGTIQLLVDYFSE